MSAYLRAASFSCMSPISRRLFSSPTHCRDPLSHAGWRRLSARRPRICSICAGTGLATRIEIPGSAEGGRMALSLPLPPPSGSSRGPSHRRVHSSPLQSWPCSAESGCSGRAGQRAANRSSRPAAWPRAAWTLRGSSTSKRATRSCCASFCVRAGRGRGFLTKRVMTRASEHGTATTPVMVAYEARSVQLIGASIYPAKVAADRSRSL